MKTGTKIGLGLLATITAISTGVYFAFISKKGKEGAIGSKEQEDKTPTKKVYGKESEDSFVSASNKHIKASIKGRIRVKKIGAGNDFLEISKKENSKKEDKKLYDDIAKVGSSLALRSIPKLVTVKSKAKKKTTPSAYQKYLQKEFYKTQVTIANSSTEEKLIRLWGANSSESISPPTPGDVEDHEIIGSVAIPTNLGTGVQPQGIAFNPKNGLSYVANQISNNVTIIDSSGQVVSVVQLEPSNLPGLNSPVAIAVNTNSSSAKYGNVYVAGSIADTVSVIDDTHSVVNEISTGARPVAIVFNPINELIYTANLGTNNVTVIDTATETVSTTLSVGTAPLGIGVNSNNGDVYVTNSTDNSVTVFDSANTLITTIASVGTRPVSATYHPISDEMFIVASDSNNVFPVNATNQTLGTPIATGNGPYTGVYNALNEFLYIGNQDDDTFTIIASNHTIRATVGIGGNINIGFTFNPVENQLLVSDTSGNTINIIGYADITKSITISGDYFENQQSFLHNPAIVKHIKWVLSGDLRFKVLNFVEDTPTGTKKSVPISHESYKNPQNFLNVSELTDLEGTMIDGKTSWLFKIAGLQTITLIVYFRQIEFEKFIPKKVAI